jgi:hypothetical protein
MKEAHSMYGISALKVQYSKHERLLKDLSTWKKYNSARNPLLRDLIYSNDNVNILWDLHQGIETHKIKIDFAQN